MSSNSVTAFQPTLSDVLVVRAMLAQAVILPELVGTILDYAEYWARSTTKARLDVSIHAVSTGPGEFDYEGSRFLLRSYPVGLTERAYGGGDGDRSHGLAYPTTSIDPLPIDRPCDREFFQNLIRNASTHSQPARKVVFRFRSHDQGWTTDERTGPFITAKTWFDAGIERFDAGHTCGQCADMRQLPVCKLRSIEPQIKKVIHHDEGHEYQYSTTPWRGPREIQRNKMASSEWADYEVTWTCWDVVPSNSAEAQRLMEQGKGKMDGDGQFVRNLRLGDIITVWGRAMHRGWVNTVQSVQIDVYWAI
ncbi:hypothetical protein TARUN_3758 [Trichoderma arundinaceum]|uniref:Uncharacterized protein n=1 Tax=Trichoderma arundinaceum TaxID=490622 RepID=A0A395NRF2_TRIAR|nr:hypothetical protein TARUN_3758 [Trichoderma arundinaceum]